MGCGWLLVVVVGCKWWLWVIVGCWCWYGWLWLCFLPGALVHQRVGRIIPVVKTRLVRHHGSPLLCVTEWICTHLSSTGPTGALAMSGLLLLTLSTFARDNYSSDLRLDPSKLDRVAAPLVSPNH